MVTTDDIPVQDAQLDPSAEYVIDAPMSLKQATLTPRRRRWFDVRDIGTQTPPYTVTPGLTAGLRMRIQYDHRPDVIIVAVSGATASTGGLFVYMGEEGGPFIRLGQCGFTVIPAPENGVVVLRAIGSTPAYGTVIAIAGYDNMPTLTVEPGVGNAPVS